jgi:hypothetical protein
MDLDNKNYNQEGYEVYSQVLQSSGINVSENFFLFVIEEMPTRRSSTMPWNSVLRFEGIKFPSTWFENTINKSWEEPFSQLEMNQFDEKSKKK